MQGSYPDVNHFRSMRREQRSGSGRVAEPFPRSSGAKPEKKKLREGEGGVGVSAGELYGEWPLFVGWGKKRDGLPVGKGCPFLSQKSR